MPLTDDQKQFAGYIASVVTKAMKGVTLETEAILEYEKWRFALERLNRIEGLHLEKFISDLNHIVKEEQEHRTMFKKQVDKFNGDLAEFARKAELAKRVEQHNNAQRLNLFNSLKKKY